MAVFNRFARPVSTELGGRFRPDCPADLLRIAQAVKESLAKPAAAGSGVPDTVQEGVTKPAAAAGSGVPNYVEQINKFEQDIIKNFGLARSQDGINAMIPAIRSYNATGLLGGSIGAPQLISAFNPLGVSGASDTSSSFIAGIGASTWSNKFSKTTLLGAPMLPSDVVNSAVGYPLTNDQQQMISSLVSMGVPFYQALSAVTSGSASIGGTNDEGSGGVSSAANQSNASSSNLTNLAKSLTTGNSSWVIRLNTGDADISINNVNDFQPISWAKAA